MSWETPPLLHHALWIGSLVLAVALTFGLRRLWRSTWLATLFAGPAPAVAIFIWFLSLEARQPVGPFYAIVGFFHAAPALLAGLFGAVSTGLYLALRDDGASPAE